MNSYGKVTAATVTVVQFSTVTVVWTKLNLILLLPFFYRNDKVKEDKWKRKNIIQTSVLEDIWLHICTLSTAQCEQVTWYYPVAPMGHPLNLLALPHLWLHYQSPHSTFLTFHSMFQTWIVHHWDSRFRCVYQVKCGHCQRHFNLHQLSQFPLQTQKLSKFHMAKSKMF